MPQEESSPLRNLEAGGSPSTTTLGKYQLFATLGRGGTADVFLAVSRGAMGFQRLAVVKRLRPMLAEDAAYVSMFLDEARLAARLTHPNLVHTYEVGEQDGAYFIAMEYLEGQSLNTVLREMLRREKELPPTYAARIVADALAGLHYAHELRDYNGEPLCIVHRDISPHNVFVCYDGQVKLMDFGIAKATSSSTTTEVGVLKGKVAYMAPEQASGEAVDRRADIFAMGIVLWEMVARRRLLSPDQAAATIHRLVTTTMPRVSTVVPDVSAHLDAIIAKALARQPEDRFATALEMRESLERYLSESGVHVRQDDIGRLVSSTFESVREDVRRQVQAQMMNVGNLQNTQELAPLKIEALRRYDASGSGGSPSLNESGSGIISSAEIPTRLAPMSGPAPGRSKHRRALVAAAMALLGALGVVAVMRPRSGASDSVVASAGAAGTTGVAGANGVPPSNGTTTVGVATGAVPPPSTATSGGAGSPSTSTPTSATTPTAANAGASGGGSSSGSRGSSTRGSSSPSHRTAPAPPPATTVKSVTPPPAHDEGQGFLTLDTYPWTRVSENGRALGTTPLVRVALPAGVHTLTLENPDEGLRQSTTVTVKTGETVTKRLAFK